MAQRAFWTGTLRIALVSVPIRLYPAIDRGHHVTLHRVHEPSGERVRSQKVVPGQGPVADEEVVRGYEYEPGRYVTLSDEELDRLRLDSVHSIDIVQFVERGEIDPIYYHRPYYVAPDGQSADEAFAVVREALRQSRKVGLGQVALGGRERIVALRPCGRGLILEALRYADELRDAGAYFQSIPDEAVDPNRLALAVRLVESKTAPFDPAAFHDRYHEAVRDLVAAKLEDREAETLEPEPAGGIVIDLEDALRRSVSESRRLAGRRGGAARSAPRPESGGGRAGGRGPGRRRA